MENTRLRIRGLTFSSIFARREAGHKEFSYNVRTQLVSMKRTWTCTQYGRLIECSGVFEEAVERNLYNLRFFHSQIDLLHSHVRSDTVEIKTSVLWPDIDLDILGEDHIADGQTVLCLLVGHTTLLSRGREVTLDCVLVLTSHDAEATFERIGISLIESQDNWFEEAEERWIEIV